MRELSDELLIEPPSGWHDCDDAPRARRCSDRHRRAAWRRAETGPRALTNIRRGATPPRRQRTISRESSSTKPTASPSRRSAARSTSPTRARSAAHLRTCPSLPLGMVVDLRGLVYLDSSGISLLHRSRDAHAAAVEPAHPRLPAELAAAPGTRADRARLAHADPRHDRARDRGPAGPVREPLSGALSDGPG